MFDLIPFSGRDRSIWNYFDNLEKSFFQNAVPADLQFRTDIVDDGDKYILHAELPGFDREDIKIDLDQERLTISASREEQSEESKDNYIRRERRIGNFRRSFDVSNINTEAIQAKYENGVLSLALPKAQPDPIPPARQIEIQ